MNQRTIEIKIQNQIVTLKTSDSAELAENIRKRVQNRINDLENRTKPGASPVFIATLALVEAIEDGISKENTVDVVTSHDDFIDHDYTGQLPFNSSAAV